MTSIPFATTVGPVLSDSLSENGVAGIFVKRSYYQQNPLVPAENRDGASAYSTNDLDSPSTVSVLLTGQAFTGFVGVPTNTDSTSNAVAVEAVSDYWIGFLRNADLIDQSTADNWDGADSDVGFFDANSLEQRLNQIDVGQYMQTFGDQTGYSYPGFDFDQPFGLDPRNPFPNQFVLDELEIDITANVVASYNQVIAASASGAGDVLVDVNQIFNDIVTAGAIQQDGLTLAPVIGSLFSLDGVHPSNYGHGLVANALIEAIRGEYNLTEEQLPDIEVDRIPQGIPID